VIGGIAGDIIGSAYEGRRATEYAFPLFVQTCRFTDDTVMTLAVASALLDNASYRDRMRELGRRYPDAGYGGTFHRWLESPDPQPYHSYGNGSAMRVGAVPWFFSDEEHVLREARRSSEPTHDHPEGIKGAEATALCIRMASGLRFGVLILDFGGATTPAPLLASALGPRLPATAWVFKELAHTLTFADLIAERAVQKTWA
jgi:ADP-ribosylglycohydrolase